MFWKKKNKKDEYSASAIREKYNIPDDTAGLADYVVYKFTKTHKAHIDANPDQRIVYRKADKYFEENMKEVYTKPFYYRVNIGSLLSIEYAIQAGFVAGYNYRQEEVENENDITEELNFQKELNKNIGNAMALLVQIFTQPKDDERIEEITREIKEFGTKYKDRLNNDKETKYVQERKLISI